MQLSKEYGNMTVLLKMTELAYCVIAGILDSYSYPLRSKIEMGGVLFMHEPIVSSSCFCFCVVGAS